MAGNSFNGGLGSNDPWKNEPPSQKQAASVAQVTQSVATELSEPYAYDLRAPIDMNPFDETPKPSAQQSPLVTSASSSASSSSSDLRQDPNTVATSSSSGPSSQSQEQEEALEDWLKSDDPTFNPFDDKPTTKQSDAKGKKAATTASASLPDPTAVQNSLGRVRTQPHVYDDLTGGWDEESVTAKRSSPHRPLLSVPDHIIVGQGYGATSAVQKDVQPEVPVAPQSPSKWRVMDLFGRVGTTSTPKTPMSTPTKVNKTGQADNAPQSSPAATLTSPHTPAEVWGKVAQDLTEGIVVAAKNVKKKTGIAIDNTKGALQSVEEHPAYYQPILAQVTPTPAPDSQKQTNVGALGSKAGARGSMEASTALNVLNVLETAEFTKSTRALMAQAVLHWIDPNLTLSELEESAVPGLMTRIEQKLSVPLFKRATVDNEPVADHVRGFVQQSPMLNKKNTAKAADLDGIIAKVAPETLLYRMLYAAGDMTWQWSPGLVDVIHTLLSAPSSISHDLLQSLCLLAVSSPVPGSLDYSGMAFTATSYHPKIDKELGLENGTAKTMSRRNLIARCIQKLMTFDMAKLAKVVPIQIAKDAPEDEAIYAGILSILDLVMTPLSALTTDQESSFMWMLQAFQKYFLFEANQNFLRESTALLAEKQTAITLTNTSIQTAEQECATLISNIAESKKQQEQATQALQEIPLEIEQKKRSVAELEGQITSLKEAGVTLTLQCEAAEQELHNKQQAAEAALKQTDLNVPAAPAEQTMADTLAEDDPWGDRSTPQSFEHIRESEKAAGEIATQQQYIAQLKGAIQKNTDETAELTEKMAAEKEALQTISEQPEKESESKEAEIQNLSEQIKAASTKHERVTGRLDRAKNALQKHEDALRALQEKIKTTKKQVEIAKGSLADQKMLKTWGLVLKECNKLPHHTQDEKTAAITDGVLQLMDLVESLAGMTVIELFQPNEATPHFALSPFFKLIHVLEAVKASGVLLGVSEKYVYPHKEKMITLHRSFLTIIQATLMQVFDLLGKYNDTAREFTEELAYFAEGTPLREVLAHMESKKDRPILGVLGDVPDITKKVEAGFAALMRSMCGVYPNRVDETMERNRQLKWMIRSAQISFPGMAITDQIFCNTVPELFSIDPNATKPTIAQMISIVITRYPAAVLHAIGAALDLAQEMTYQMHFGNPAARTHQKQTQSSMPSSSAKTQTSPQSNLLADATPVAQVSEEAKAAAAMLQPFFAERKVFKSGPVITQPVLSHRLEKCASKDALVNDLSGLDGLGRFSFLRIQDLTDKVNNFDSALVRAQGIQEFLYRKVYSRDASKAEACDIVAVNAINQGTLASLVTLEGLLFSNEKLKWTPSAWIDSLLVQATDSVTSFSVTRFKESRLHFGFSEGLVNDQGLQEAGIDSLDKPTQRGVFFRSLIAQDMMAFFRTILNTGYRNVTGQVFMQHLREQVQRGILQSAVAVIIAKFEHDYPGTLSAMLHYQMPENGLDQIVRTPIAVLEGLGLQGKASALREQENVQGGLTAPWNDDSLPWPKEITSWVSLYLMVIVTHVHATAKRKYAAILDRADAALGESSAMGAQRKPSAQVPADLNELTIALLTNLAATHELKTSQQAKEKADAQQITASQKTPAQRAMERKKKPKVASLLPSTPVAPTMSSSMAIDFAKSADFMTAMREKADALFEENVHALMARYGQPSAAQKSLIEEHYADGRYHVLDAFRCYLSQAQGQSNVFAGFKEYLESNSGDFRKKYPSVVISYKDINALKFDLRSEFQIFLKSHAPAMIITVGGSGMQARAVEPSMIDLVLELQNALESVTLKTFFTGKDAKVVDTTAAVTHPEYLLKKMFARVSLEKMQEAAKKGMDASDWKNLVAEKELLEAVLALMLKTEHQPVTLNFAVNPCPEKHIIRAFLAGLIKDVFTVEAAGRVVRISLTNPIKVAFPKSSDLQRAETGDDALKVMDKSSLLFGQMGSVPDLLSQVSVERALVAFLSIRSALMNAAYEKVANPQGAQPGHQGVADERESPTGDQDVSALPLDRELKQFYKNHLKSSVTIPFDADFRTFFGDAVEAYQRQKLHADKPNDGDPMLQLASHLSDRLATYAKRANTMFRREWINPIIKSAQAKASGETDYGDANSAYRQLENLLSNWVIEQEKKKASDVAQNSSSSSASASGSNVEQPSRGRMQSAMAYGTSINVRNSPENIEHQRLRAVVDSLKNPETTEQSSLPVPAPKPKAAPTEDEQGAPTAATSQGSKADGSVDEQVDEEVQGSVADSDVAHSEQLAGLEETSDQGLENNNNSEEDEQGAPTADRSDSSVVDVEPSKPVLAHVDEEVVARSAPTTHQDFPQGNNEVDDSADGQGDEAVQSVVLDNTNDRDLERGKGKEPPRSRNFLKHALYALAGMVGTSAAFGIGMALGAFVPTAAAAGTTTLGLAIFGGIAGITSIGAAAATGGILAGVVLLAIGIALFATWAMKGPTIASDEASDEVIKVTIVQSPSAAGSNVANVLSPTYTAANDAQRLRQGIGEEQNLATGNERKVRSRFF